MKFRRIKIFLGGKVILIDVPLRVSLSVLCVLIVHCYMCHYVCVCVCALSVDPYLSVCEHGRYMCWSFINT